jgi:hypothetical protein
MGSKARDAPVAADFEVAIKLLEKVSTALSAIISSSRTAPVQLQEVELQADKLGKLLQRLGDTYGAAMAPAAFAKLMKNKVGLTS